jgi:DNA-binding PadR family transcriptional regulator
MKPDAQALKGHLDTMLLATLEAGPRHGYSVRETLRESSGGRLDLPSGTVYPALHRLEAAGLISGSWLVAGGRKRRVYQLTAAGRRRLAGDRAFWRDFTAVVSAILEPPPWPAAT